MSVDDLIQSYGGAMEVYSFYNGSIELHYDPVAHIYYRVIEGEMVPQEGVTTVCHIIDKSPALIPWACKMMAAKLLTTIEPFITDGNVGMEYAAFEKLVLTAKSAHEEHLDAAADIGSKAHNWIERYIKTGLSGAIGLPFRPALDLLDDMPADDRARNCCIAALEWMTKHNVEWVSTERKIYSLNYGYAGTEDGKAYVSSCGGVCCPTPFERRLSVIDWKSSNYLYNEYLLQTAAYMNAELEEFDEAIEDRWVIRLGKEDAKFDPWHLEGEDLFHQDFAAFLTALTMYRSVKALEKRMKGHAAAIRAEKKAIAQKAKEESLKIKCKGADKYKGVRSPKCNGGNPCQTCLAIYANRRTGGILHNVQSEG